MVDLIHSRVWLSREKNVMFNAATAPAATSFHGILTNDTDFNDNSTIKEVLVKELLNSDDYARVNYNPGTSAWNAATSRTEFPNTNLVFTAGSSALTFDGFVLLADSTLTANKTVASIASDALTITANGLSANNQVFFFNPDGSYPTGMTAMDTYFVRNPTTNTIQIATTEGGSPISLGTSWVGVLTAYYLLNNQWVAYGVLPAPVTIAPSQTYTATVNFYGRNP